MGMSKNLFTADDTKLSLLIPEIDNFKSAIQND